MNNHKPPSPESERPELLPGNRSNPAAIVAPAKTPEVPVKAAAPLLQSGAPSPETLLDGVNDLIFVQDIEGRILAVNSTITRIFGYSREEVIGRRTIDFLRQDQKELFRTNYLVPVMRQGSCQGLSVFLDKNGDEHWLECRCTLLKPDRGDPFIIGTGRDVTQEIQAERAFNALQQQFFEIRKMRALGTLAGGIAHEFNNILSIIIGNVELAMDDIPQWNSTHLFLEEIYRASLRARDVVRQLTTSSGKPPKAKKPVPFQPMIEQSMLRLAEEIPDNIALCSQLTAPAVAVLAEPADFHLLLKNLISNAILAMAQDGGKLLVAAKEVYLNQESAARHPGLQTGPHVELRVRDNGCGIESKHMDRIFDPYFSTREVGQGSGMGLAIVHGIVRNHGATISVASEPGSGTTFTLLFPVTDQVPVPGQILEPEVLEESARILLVDDEAVLADMGKQILEHLGYRVEATASPIQALDLFRSRPDDFDLVITDLTMAELSGDRLAEEILQLRPNQPIIMCSGFSRKMARESSTRLRVDAYLEKPVRKEQLAATIRRVLRDSPVH